MKENQVVIKLHLCFSAVSYQGHNRREASSTGGEGYRIYERWPNYGGRFVCKSWCERRLQKVSGSVVNPVTFHSPGISVFFFFFQIVSFSRLQRIADRLVEHFVSAGLMVREWDQVKLHGTVINTLFRKDHTGRTCRWQVEQLCLLKKIIVIDTLW